MRHANLSSERLFLNQVRLGKLLVRRSGRVFNALTGHEFVPREGFYKQISHRINNEKHWILAHRLVWISFMGEIKDSALEVNHKNGFKSDNRLSNLELMTPSDNCKHALSTGLAVPRIGSKHGRSKFTEEQVLKLRKAFSTGKYSLGEFARSSDVSLSTMYGLLSGATWKHVVSGYEKRCQRVLCQNKSILNN